MVYGVQENSAYIKSSIADDEVLISNAYANKQHIKTGDTITLQEEYGEKTYSFTVTGIYTYPAALSVFMNCDAFGKTFEKGSYYPGYFSNEELTDLTAEKHCNDYIKGRFDKDLQTASIVNGRYGCSLPGLWRDHVCAAFVSALKGSNREKCTVNFHGKDFRIQ